MVVYNMKEATLNKQNRVEYYNYLNFLRDNNLAVGKYPTFRYKFKHTSAITRYAKNFIKTLVYYYLIKKAKYICI